MLDEIKKLLKDRGIESLVTPDIDEADEEDLTGMIEVWHKKRKMTIYFYEDCHATQFGLLLRVWGPHIHDEMSEHKIESADDAIKHIDWLIGG